jgi:hypothetical protein
MSIHSVSLELFEKIYRYLDPASHLDFALTDKHIFRYSNGILERHRRYHQSYHTFSEQDPESLTNLLRNVAMDHVAAWHIRTFEGLNARTRYIVPALNEAEPTNLAKNFNTAMITNGFPAFSLDRMQTNGYFLEVIQTAILALSTGLHTIKSTAFFPAVDDNANGNITDNLWISTQMS